MTVTDLTRILNQHPFCEQLPDDIVALLAGCARNVKVPAGAFLAREGETADSTFLLRHGRVALEVGRNHVFETVEGGELLGWSWLFPPYHWGFDARALTPVRAFELDGACLRKKCEADPAVGFALSKAILRQVQTRLERARMRGLDVYGASR